METLYHQLKKINKTNKISFHMPGLRNGAALPPEYAAEVLELDTTELRDTDNLMAPEGILRDAQDAVAGIYGAANTFFLVNGATGGILSCFGYLSQRGKRILVDRNCHVSVVHAMGLFQIEPVFVLPDYQAQWGHMGCVAPERVEECLAKDSSIRCVFLTSPNYYGWTADIKKMEAVCAKYGVLLCVDAAHGAHFPFSPLLPQSAVDAGADLAVMSMHKTMPAPTQTAVLHTSRQVDTAEMKYWVNCLQTTSPSYIFMAYIDLAAAYMKRHGAEIYASLYQEIRSLPEELPLVDGGGRDFSRLVISAAAKGGNGCELADYLYHKWNIEVEMADAYSVVCIAGAGNVPRHFALLAEGCKQYFHTIQKKPAVTLPPPPLCAGLTKPVVAGVSAWKAVPVREAVGRRAARMVTPYPPGVPVLLPGEIITCDMADYLLLLREAGVALPGMEKDCIFVINS